MKLIPIPKSFEQFGYDLDDIDGVHYDGKSAYRWVGRIWDKPIDTSPWYDFYRVSANPIFVAWVKSEGNIPLVNLL